MIGVLKDTAPLRDGRHLDLAGHVRAHSRDASSRRSTTSRSRRESTRRRRPTQLESAFLANGLQADSLQKVLDDALAANRTFNRLIQGFMVLGLVVGVAALGVISARAVVERRQQIGVLRAIGFRRGMVQAVFLIESSFIALTSIVVGTVLGLILADNIIRDSAKQPSWENLTLVVPWGTSASSSSSSTSVALAATLAPAMRASRIRPAEALRYQ